MSRNNLIPHLNVRLRLFLAVIHLRTNFQVLTAEPSPAAISLKRNAADNPIEEEAPLCP